MHAGLRAGDSDLSELGLPGRGVDSLAPNMRFAVLVDAESTQYNLMEAIVEELAKFGTTSIRCVYGDFTKGQLFPWKQVALDLSSESAHMASLASLAFFPM